MFDDLDWCRDLKWLRRLDQDLSYIVECAALDDLSAAHDRILSLRGWLEASSEVGSSRTALVDFCKSALADWHYSGTLAISRLVELKRTARAQLDRLQEEQLAAWAPVPHTFQTVEGPFWAPISLDAGGMLALAVENTTGQPMSAALHHELITRKVAQLFERAGESHARDVLKMSVEHFPELWTISKLGNPKDWPTMVMHSDSMMQLLNRISWDVELHNAIPEDHPSQEDIAEWLVEETLWSFLEHL